MAIFLHFFGKSPSTLGAGDGQGIVFRTRSTLSSLQLVRFSPHVSAHTFFHRFLV